MAGGGGGMNWEIGIDMYTLICIKWITNKKLLYKKNKIKFKNSKKKGLCYQGAHSLVGNAKQINKGNGKIYSFSKHSLTSTKCQPSVRHWKSEIRHSFCFQGAYIVITEGKCELLHVIMTA